MNGTLTPHEAAIAAIHRERAVNRGEVGNRFQPFEASWAIPKDIVRVVPAACPACHRSREAIAIQGHGRGCAVAHGVVAWQ